jgi:prophage tail gpP-like protein
MQNNDVSLIVAGKAHDKWTEYQIDSDFLIPADAWRVSMGIPDGVFPEDVKKGAAVMVKIGDDVVMKGRIDNVKRTINRDSMKLTLNGRDSAGQLVDCAAPVFTAKQLSITEAIAQIVRPLGITNIDVRAENLTRFDKVNIEPGERAWDALTKICNANGLHCWVEPDGTLIIGGADYTTPPVASLIMNFNGDGNNILSIDETDSIQNCYSELIILAQGHAQGASGRKKKETGIVSLSRSDTTDYETSSAQIGRNNIKVAVEDESINYYRPQIVVLGDADNLEQARWRARKMMADARLNGYGLIVQVKGHRTSEDVLWQPGQRIHVKCEPLGIDEIFFLMGREFSNSRHGGKVTTLRLKEDGLWTPDAFKSKARTQSKKGSSSKKKQLGIVDVSADK